MNGSVTAVLGPSDSDSNMPQEARPETGIARGYRMLEESVRHLEIQTSRLLESLSPVLTPATPPAETAQNRLANHEGAPLGGAMQVMAEKIAAATEALETANRRLDL